MSLVVHTLRSLSDDEALASKNTLPHFLRLKSQSLCKYLSVSKDGKGRLTFSAKMDHCDISIVFETVHVQALENLRPHGWKGVKIKSLATNKYWKCVDNSKELKYATAQHEKQGVGTEKFRVIMAIADSEEDADIFEFEVKEVGKESEKVILRNPIDRRYLAPFKLSQTVSLHTADFLGSMCKEISWKESILIVECVVEPRTLWPMGISSECALATFILSNHVEPSEDETNENLCPPTIILPPSFLPLETIQPSNRKRSLDNILIGSTETLEMSRDNTKDVVSAKEKSHMGINTGSSSGEPVQASNKKKGLEKASVRDAVVVPEMLGKSSKDDSNKKSPKGINVADEMDQHLVESRALGGCSRHNDKEGEKRDPNGDMIELLNSPTFRLSAAPRKLKPEEMAVLYSDSPDPGTEQDPSMTNISHFESEFIHYMIVDWAKDWKYSLTAKNHDEEKPLPASISKSQSEQKSHHSHQLWERMKLLKTWTERQSLIDEYIGNAPRREGLQEVVNKD